MKSGNQTNQFFEGGIFMTKKILCLVMAVMMLAGTTVFACETNDLPIGYYNIVYANRYLFFATDGGSSFKPLELPD